MHDTVLREPKHQENPVDKLEQAFKILKSKPTISSMLESQDSLGTVLNEYKEVKKRYVDSRIECPDLLGMRRIVPEEDFSDMNSDLFSLFDIGHSSNPGFGLEFGDEGGLPHIEIAQELKPEYLEGYIDFWTTISTTVNRIFLQTNQGEIDYDAFTHNRSYINTILATCAVRAVKNNHPEVSTKAINSLSYSYLPTEYQDTGVLPPSLVKTSGNILRNPSLNLAQRKELLKEFITAFGPIESSDLLSQLISEEKNENILPELKDLYFQLQGSHVKKPITKLEDLYAAIPYSENGRTEQTKKEADRVERIIALAQKSLPDPKNIDPKSIPILGLGSGNARLESELYARGYKNVIASDTDPTNLEYARKLSPPNMSIIQSTWHNIPLPTPDIHNKDTYSKAPLVTGTQERSFLHNRRPTEWLKLFNEVRRVTRPEGFFFFDIPDINSGYYKQETEKYKDNLKKTLT